MTDAPKIDTQAPRFFLRTPSGMMIEARPDAKDNDRCSIYVRKQDYDALDRLIAERVREAVEAEREACAKLADEKGKAGKFIGMTIRARGSEEEFNAKYASNPAIR